MNYKQFFLIPLKQNDKLIQVIKTKTLLFQVRTTDFIMSKTMEFAENADASGLPGTHAFGSSQPLTHRTWAQLFHLH